MNATSRPGTILGVMCAGMFLVLLDVSAVQVALPSIGRSLGASLAGLQWVVDAYAVALAALLLPSGALADRWGRRRMVLAGLGGFGLASLACALSPTTGVLVATRAVQGVGAAVLLPATMAVIAQAFPGRRERARALGLWAGISSLALPAGPVVGGVLVTAVGWRVVFLVNLPVVAAAAGLTHRVVRESRHPGRTTLDVTGAVSLTIGLAAVVHAVISAGHDGLGPEVLVSSVVAIAAGAVFLRAEARAADPVLPLGVLRTRSFVGPNIVAACMNLVGIGTIFAVTLYLQQLQRRSPMTSGLALVPLFLPLAALSPLTGRLVARFGPRLPMVSGLVVGALGCASLVLPQANSPYAVLLPPLLGLGVGMGLLTSAVVTAAMQALSPERAGLAGGANNTVRQAGGALGVAGFGAVLGSAHAAGGFVAHLHLLGLSSAALWLLAAALTLLTVRPIGRRPATSGSPTEPGTLGVRRPAGVLEVGAERGQLGHQIGIPAVDVEVVGDLRLPLGDQPGEHHTDGGADVE